jgi:hypothetical protein
LSHTFLFRARLGRLHVRCCLPRQHDRKIDRVVSCCHHTTLARDTFSLLAKVAFFFLGMLEYYNAGYSVLRELQTRGSTSLRIKIESPKYPIHTWYGSVGLKKKVNCVTCCISKESSWSPESIAALIHLLPPHNRGL